MVGLNFDVGHAYCVGEDPQDWVAKMADAHACTIISKTSPPRGSTSTWCPAAGRSTSRPRSPRFAQTGYDGWLTVELYPYLDDPDTAARTEAKEFYDRTVAGAF